MILDKALLNKNISDRIKLDIAEKRICGAAVGVYQNGEELLKKCYGSSRVFENSPLNAKSIFRAASMTKPITSVAVMKEIEKGNLSLFTPAEEFFPALKNTMLGTVENGKIKILGKAKNKIKINNLLTHTSGLDGGELGAEYRKTLTDCDLTSLKTMSGFFARAPLPFEPGEGHIYSESGAFDLLARIIEIISGKSYTDYLNEEIFSPLGMVDTGFEPTKEQLSRFTDMHAFNGKEASVRKMPEGCVFENRPYRITSAGAGLFTTLDDYCKFANMLLSGEYNGARILSENAVRELGLPHIAEKFCYPINWSFGMRVVQGEEYGLIPVGCFGWSGAYGSHFFVDPKNKIAAVYLKNSSFDGGSEAVTGKHFEADVYSSVK